MLILREITEKLRHATTIAADPAVRIEQNQTLLTRSRVLCLLALVIYPFTILSYVAAFYPEQLWTGLIVAIAADAAALVLLLGLGAGIFDKLPGMGLFVLLGVISNAAELATLTITGGPADSTFFFPYYLIFFGIATFFPGRLATVLSTCLALPLGYLGLGWALGATSERYWSNLILLVDYALLAVIANRVVTTTFLSEVRARRELQNANERLMDLDRAKSEFFANISHELRTPLTLMLAPASSLLGLAAGPLTPEQERLVVGMRRNAVRLLGLINDLLLLAKLEAGEQSVKRVPVELSPLLERTVEGMRPYASSLGIELTLEIPEGGHLWSGDDAHLDRMVMNLVSNACKFSEADSRVTVRLEAWPTTFVVSVADEGVGIAADDMTTLFDRFVQIDSGVNRRFEGTGIGLALVKELAELHGGSVGVESTPGVGSTFTVFLPKSEAQPDESLKHSATDSFARKPEPVAAPYVPERQSRQHGARVMVVEDNEDLLSYLEQELTRDYQVEAIVDSSRALERIREDPPDIVLSDIMMPVMDGIELARCIKGDRATQELPVILMSALEDVETKLEGFEVGVDDYVSKPFQMEELRARLNVHLRLRAQAMELADALDKLKHSEASLVQHERMAVLGTVVAGIAHEVNNPIHFMQGNLKLLRKELGKRLDVGEIERVDEMLNDLVESMHRLEFVAGELLRFGRKDHASNEDMNLGEVIALAIRVVGARADGVEFETSLSDQVRAHGNPQAMFQITLNLLQNALQAEAGHVRVESEQRNETVELRFVDDGCGIAGEVLGDVMQPFYTTKAPGMGTGLGLSIVQKLMDAQGGSVAIDSQVGRGTTVSLQLPTARHSS